jgi:enoyl-CoA hydratase
LADHIVAFPGFAAGRERPGDVISAAVRTVGRAADAHDHGFNAFAIVTPADDLAAIFLGKRGIGCDARGEGDVIGDWLGIGWRKAGEELLALTGARLDGAECHYLGLATHYIPHESLAEVKEQIAARPERIEGILGKASVTPPAARIADTLVHLNKTFASDNLEEILEALEADDSEWAETELATLRAKSPQSCKVSLRLLAEGAGKKDFADEMREEYAVAARVVKQPDFIEGVRAVLIDKHNQPKWDPDAPEGVTDTLLDQIFAPLPKSEEWTPLPN